MQRGIYEVFVRCQMVLIALGILIHPVSQSPVTEAHVAIPLYKESEAQKVREFAWNYTASVYQLDFEFNQINSKSHSYSLILCLDI